MTAPLLPHWQDDSVQLFHGDCLEVLAQLPDDSVDSVVTDPPYGLGFMGKEWDSAAALASRPPSAERNPLDGAYPRTGKGPGAVAFDGPVFQQWCEQWARECLRVLKPGGHLLAFGGTRTWHRLACAVEDAGFEVRDSLAWLYGSGFPKSLDVSKAIDKAAGATREVVGFRQQDAQVMPTNLPSGEGWMVNTGERMQVPITAPATPAAEQWQGWGTALKPAFEPVVVARKPLAGTVAVNVLSHGTGALNIDATRVGPDGGTRRNGKADRPNDAGWENMRGHGIAPLDAGRWPANVLLDDSQAAALDRQSGTSRSVVRQPTGRPIFESSQSFKGGGEQIDKGERGVEDEGGASRFFPTFRYEPKAPTSERPRDGEVAHPTVKPLDLMRWLVKLVTPPSGLVLEPFAGSGTTAEACVIEGFRCIAVEREATYLPLIIARLSKPIALDLFGGME